MSHYLDNPILDVDSYKTSHVLQYPPKTEIVHSYIESRGGEFNKLVFFGLQAFLMQLQERPITTRDIEEADTLFEAHGVPFNEPGWRTLVREHDGRLPIIIRALPEGTVVSPHVPLVTVENTDPEFAWLTSYIETALLRAVWYPTTVATLSWHCRKVIKEYLDRTADNSNGLPFKLHDFGARGVSSRESAAIGGLAHLVSFNGTDNVSALLAGLKFYDEPIAGFSIPAMEHSTVTAWGRDNEFEAYENMLTHFARPGKVLAAVSDSYDLWNAIENIWGSELRGVVRESGATVVIRPDSGDPVEVVPKAIEMLMDRFGFYVNSKGYKQLPSCVRVIQGDGVNLKSIEAILYEMTKRNLSAENVAFGMGGGLLQQINRDTLRFAMKTSAVRVCGEWRDAYKDPSTDAGKASKRGRQAVTFVRGTGARVLKACRVEDAGIEKNSDNQLEPVFLDGYCQRIWSLGEIRARAQS
jgi:nicotinamide phosphoribosyltransferase